MPAIADRSNPTYGVTLLGPAPAVPTRRQLLAGTLALLPFSAFATPRSAITLAALLNSPPLARFYRSESQNLVAPDGIAGANRNPARRRLVEEQRNGTEWVICGVIAGRADWRALGWRALDLGLAWQQPDGGFGKDGYYHSNSLYLEGLARACIIDPKAVTAAHRRCLSRGCAWLMRPDAIAVSRPQSDAFVHRRYILAACLGQAGAVVGDPQLAAAAACWAEEGLALQRHDGVNPELDGGDVSYQMVGVLFALRYYPTASPAIQARLRGMIAHAIAWELPHIADDGTILTAGSTRAGREIASGELKQPNYPEVFQALVYADAVMPHPDWRRAGIAVASRVRLPLPEGMSAG